MFSWLKKALVGDSDSGPEPEVATTESPVAEVPDEAPAAMVVRLGEAGPSTSMPPNLGIVDAVIADAERTAPSGFGAGGERKRSRKSVTALPDPRFGVVGPSAAWDGSGWAGGLTGAAPSLTTPAGASTALALVPSNAAVVAEVAEPCAWWVLPGVCKEDLLAAYTWELAQAFKHALVQPFHFQMYGDRQSAPKFTFSRNYADAVSIDELDEAGRHFRPPVQQMLDVLGAVLASVPHQIVPSILVYAALTPPNSQMGLPELRELFAPVCLQPPEVDGAGKLRVALPKDGSWRPRGAGSKALWQVAGRWKLGSLAHWWVDLLPRTGALPPMGSRLFYAILLAEARLSQRDAETILGHETIDPSQPHSLELLVRVRRSGQLNLGRARSLCTLTVPHDAPVSALAEAVNSREFAEAFRAARDNRHGDDGDESEDEEGGREWERLSLVDKSPSSTTRDEARHLADELVISDVDRAMVLTTVIGMHPAAAQHAGHFALTQITAHLRECVRTGAGPLGKAQALGSLSALASQRVHAALDPLSADSLSPADTGHICAVHLNIRRDCALADLLPPVETRVPLMSTYLREGNERRCLSAQLHSNWGDEADVFVLRRVRAQAKKRGSSVPAKTPILTSVHGTPQHVFL